MQSPRHASRPTLRVAEPAWRRAAQPRRRSLLVAWGLSITLHIAGLAALATTSAWRPTELPSLSGTHNVSGLELLVSQATREPDQVVELDRPVTVMPAEAHVGDQYFVHAAPPLPLPAVEVPAPRVSSPSNELPPPEPAPPLAMRLPAPPLPAPAEPPPRPPRETTPSRAGAPPQTAGTDDLTPPQLVSNTPPVYPAQARLERRQGTVILRLEVGPAGEVVALDIAQSSGHAILDAAALRAVRTWRFQPAQQAGRSVAWTGRLPVRFVLD